MGLKPMKSKKVVKGWRAVYDGKPVTYHPSFAGLPFEEDIEDALNKCIEVLGPIGKYAFGSDTHPGIVLATEKHGKLWYGDLTEDDVTYRLEALRVKLGVDQLLAYNFAEDVSVAPAQSSLDPL